MTLKARDGLPVAALFAGPGPDGSPVDRPSHPAHPALLPRQRSERGDFPGIDRRDPGPRPECPGPGLSRVRPERGTASEANCYATADAAYEHLMSRPDIDPDRVLIGGFSLGGAVAIDLASRKPRRGSDRVLHVHHDGRDGLGALPVRPNRLLLRHEFRSLDKIGRVDVPILLGNGGIDRIVSPAMIEALAKPAGNRMTRVTMAGVGHDDIFWAATGEDRRKIVAFLRLRVPARRDEFDDRAIGPVPPGFVRSSLRSSRPPTHNPRAPRPCCCMAPNSRAGQTEAAP